MADETSPARRRLWPTALTVSVLLPLVAAWVLVWSTAHRQEALDKVPVAIVNDDTILTGSQPMAAGRALSASLTDPTSGSEQLAWTLTDKAAIPDVAHHMSIQLDAFKKSMSGTVQLEVLWVKIYRRP